MQHTPRRTKETKNIVTNIASLCSQKFDLMFSRFIHIKCLRVKSSFWFKITSQESIKIIVYKDKMQMVCQCVDNKQWLLKKMWMPSNTLCIFHNTLRWYIYHTVHHQIIITLAYVFTFSQCLLCPTMSSGWWQNTAPTASPKLNES